MLFKLLLAQDGIGNNLKHSWMQKYICLIWVIFLWSGAKPLYQELGNPDSTCDSVTI